jgi:hypothetical protein
VAEPCNGRRWGIHGLTSGVEVTSMRARVRLARHSMLSVPMADVLMVDDSNLQI